MAETSLILSHTGNEKHRANGTVLRDLIIGFADGLTVPFALTAGLSSLGSSKLVITGGLAELFSGAISMGLGAYLASVTDMQHYNTERLREEREVQESPGEEMEEIYRILCAYGPQRADVAPFVNAMRSYPDQWVQFMMDFELKLEQPARRSAYVSAIVMGISYFIGNLTPSAYFCRPIRPSPSFFNLLLTRRFCIIQGGLLPMIPYFAIHHATRALFVSIGMTAVILIIFGYFKCVFAGCDRRQSIWGAVQTLCVGAAAAGASYGIVRAVDSSNIR
ncbi:uncharacterized protein Z520_02372 [Fonsecaea multimorphosa CBS 102226]|uniref:Uncharacterized protein n=1 Tax=Fonsecaea multimorphosa CBS 102226 TaxID=1442371 RepID=A0A0D2KZQ0_9EURO|nr:uncharacterized protein Z520_02372 [Fonsecaea multimorphosa CBS 102226]KIY02234.1 hypothetical protein Z520_02372 [Fonsecaea multimorphosa CBS 102226]OAL29425.1 hypothetical protein AYO22_02319 [Fonsecaea multimorphosa]